MPLHTNRECRPPFTPSERKMPGRSTHLRLLDGALLVSMAIVGTILSVFALAADIFKLPWMSFLFAGILGVSLVTLMIGYRAMIRNKKGFQAEKKVGDILQQFERNGARVLHDLTGDGFNIDHVVIDRYGIFVIETKYVSKRAGVYKLLCKGDKILMGKTPLMGNPIGQARGGAAWIRKQIEFNGLKAPMKSLVKAAVIFPGWYITGRPRSQDVWVLNENTLPKWLEKQPPQLSSDEVKQLYNCLRANDVRTQRNLAA